MLSHCLIVKTKNGRVMLSWNYAVCGNKNLSRIIEKPPAKELLDNLVGSLSKIPLVGSILF